MAATQCVTCKVGFENVDEMRKHFSSDFHVNNVRLRVDAKPPLTKSQFAAQSAGEGAAEATSGPAFSCNLCKKTFRSIQTLQSHVKSTEHLMRKEARILLRDSNAGSTLSTTSLGSAALGLHRRHKAHHKAPRYADAAAGMTGSVGATTAPPVAREQREADVDEKTCLFCGHPSEDVAQNLEHMCKVHEFTVPLEHRVTDLTGLLQYLARKINGCVCLVCGASTKKFETLEALRNHMVAAQHDYVVLSPEYEDFYEGTLADPDAVAEPIAASKIVVVHSTEDGETKQRAVLKRHEGRLLVRRTETEQQAQERRAITAVSNEANAVLLKERAERDYAIRRAELNIRGHCAAVRNKQTMGLGVKANKLHPKGFDGEGMF